MSDDPNWLRASTWLAGDTTTSVAASVALFGAPVHLSSITPGRCDLAPGAIRAAFARYSTWDFDAGLDVRELKAVDAGDLDVAGLPPESALKPIAAAVLKACREHEAAIILGGDNSITWPGVHGLGLPLQHCALLTLDAHLDLRDTREGLSNGNPIRALLEDGLPGGHIVQVGMQSFANSPHYAAVAQRAGIRVVSAGEVRARGIEGIVAEGLAELAQKADAIYVDLDLDVMDRAFAPGTPGSRPGGLTPADIRAAAHLCGLHPKVRAIDLVEFDPQKDIADITALAAAGCVLSFASGVLRRIRLGGHA